MYLSSLSSKKHLYKASYFQKGILKRQKDSSGASKLEKCGRSAFKTNTPNSG